MIGNDEYRLAVDHWSALIKGTASWPDMTGQERAPFVEAPYRHTLEDPTGLPSVGAHRKFQILVMGVGPSEGLNYVSGTVRATTLPFRVVVAYHLGGGDNCDERELRILAAGDAEAIKQQLTHPSNYLINTSDIGTGTLLVRAVGDAEITADEDRVLCTMNFRASMRVTVEPAQGAAA